MPEQKKIRVRDTGGQLLEIDPGDLDAARSSGAERLYQMNTHDNPKGWWIGEKDVHSALQDGAFLMSPDDITANIGKEGTYKMTGPGGKQPVPIKYSMVGSAANAGYVMDQPDRQRYMTDAVADPALKHLKLRHGVKATGRNTAGQVMVAPEEEKKAGVFGKLVTPIVEAGKGIAKIVDPIATPEEQAQMAKSGPVGRLYDNIMYPWERLVAPNVQEGQRAAEEGKGGNKYEAAMHGTAAAVPMLGPMAEGMREGFAEDEASGDFKGLAASGVGNAFVIEAPHLVKPLGDVITNSAKSVSPESLRNFIRSPLGMTDKIENYVQDFNDESEKVRQNNKTAEEKTNKARGVVDENNKTITRKHHDDVEEHGRKVRRIRESHEDDVARAQKKRALEEQKHRDTTAKTQQDNVQAQKNHIAEVARIAQDKEAAQGIINREQTLDSQIEQHSQELDKRVEDARVKARSDDDAAWNTVRQKTTGTTTPIGTLKATVESAEKLADPASSPIFKSILRTEDVTAKPVHAGGMLMDATNPRYAEIYEELYGEPPPLTGVGGEIDFNRLHRWYSYLSNKMYGGGRLEPGTYRAYQMVLKGIDNAMQDIAKKTNATADLDTARDLHTKRMEAFYDSPTEPETVATKYVKETTPDYVKKNATIERGKKLGAYDPEIPKIADAIKKARAEADALPGDADRRKMMSQEVPAPPVPSPLPDPLEPPEPVKEPEYPKPPEPLETKLDKYGEPHDTQPMPDAAKVGKNIARDLNRGLRKYGQVGPWVLRSIIGGEALHLLFQGHLSTFGTTMLIGQGAVSLLTSALRRPSVIEWLQRPNAEEIRAIEQLPPSDAARLRQALGVLAAEDAHRLGGKPMPPFNPAMARFMLGAGAAQQPTQSLDELRKEAEKRKPQQQAAPGPQSNAAPSGATHEFDELSGKIIPIHA